MSKTNAELTNELKDAAITRAAMDTQLEAVEKKATELEAQALVLITDREEAEKVSDAALLQFQKEMKASEELAEDAQDEVERLTGQLKASEEVVGVAHDEVRRLTTRKELKAPPVGVEECCDHLVAAAEGTNTSRFQMLCILSEAGKRRLRGAPTGGS